MGNMMGEDLKVFISNDHSRNLKTAETLGWMLKKHCDREEFNEIIAALLHTNSRKFEILEEVKKILENY